MNPAKARSNCPTQSKLQLPTVPSTAMTGDFLLAQSATSCHYAADKAAAPEGLQDLCGKGTS